MDLHDGCMLSILMVALCARFCHKVDTSNPDQEAVLSKLKDQTVNAITADLLEAHVQQGLAQVGAF